MNQVVVLGIGHKARHGKDTLAKYITEKLKTGICLTVHWADALKEEVMNKAREFPLIYTHADTNNNQIYYSILNKTKYGYMYHLVEKDEVPMLHKIFQDRKIDIYWGMDGNGDDEHKDALMLQFWGTDYRRTMFDQNYWVDKTMKKIFDLAITYSNPTVPVCILVPDTRFKNEVSALTGLLNNPEYTIDDTAIQGVYVKVSRTNSDGTPYVDPSRSSDHPSECDLNGVTANIEMTAVSGDFNSIYLFGDTLLEHFQLQ